MTYARQLALPFPQHASYDAASFIATPATGNALTWLDQPAGWPNLRLAAYGPEGCGKTHLLHVFAQRHGATLLPGAAVRHLVDLPERGALAVDDADAAPEPEALLHLLNAAAERGLPVLLAGRTPPAHWRVCLPDLASRLRATTAVALGQPDDDLLPMLLARLFADRQLRVDPSVHDYLLARLPRHGAALREAVSCLDRLALASGGRVSRALAAEALARLGSCDDSAATGGRPSHDAATLL